MLRDGQPPSMPEAAEAALVSLATAYRYFSSAEELWQEAAIYHASSIFDPEGLAAALDAAGDDVEARVTAMVQTMGWALIDHALISRQTMKASLDRWFAAQSKEDEERERPVRPGLRNKWNSLALEPLRGVLEDDQVDALVEALGFVIGVEAVMTLFDVLHLSPEAAKQRQLTTALWILRGGLADFANAKPAPKKKGSS